MCIRDRLIIWLWLPKEKSVHTMPVWQRKPLILLCRGIIPVSYTHLDVYKRQTVSTPKYSEMMMDNYTCIWYVLLMEIPYGDVK